MGHYREERHGTASACGFGYETVPENKSNVECVNTIDSDDIKNPSHYKFFDMEAIEIIQMSLTEEEFIGYLKGNSLKYRLRCGKKDAVMKDLGKAEEYERMYRDIV